MNEFFMEILHILLFSYAIQYYRTLPEIIEKQNRCGRIFF